MVENCKPATATPRENVLAIASIQKRGKEANVSGNANAQEDQTVFEGKWDFGSKSGAILAAYKPIQSSLPYDLDYNLVAEKLAGKYIVNSVTMCPAYALYLGSREDSGITLTLQVETPDVGVKWIKDYNGGFYREGNQYEPCFTVLFDLRRCVMRKKATWLRDSPEPDFEGSDKLEVVANPPWGLLDDDGEEEPVYNKNHGFKLDIEEGEWD